MSAFFASFEQCLEVTDYKKFDTECRAQDGNQICFEISPNMDIARKFKSYTACICRHAFRTDFSCKLNIKSNLRETVCFYFIIFIKVCLNDEPGLIDLFYGEIKLCHMAFL